MTLFVDPQGVARCIYGEAIDLARMGSMTIQRASHVEPDDDGLWHADLSPVGGAKLGPFAKRSDALAAETGWLEHYLESATAQPHT